MSTLDALIKERARLVQQLADAPKGGYPGTRKARQEMAAKVALDLFDRQNPAIRELVLSQAQKGGCR